MKWWKVIAITAVLLFSASVVGAAEIKADADLSVGYRSDKIDWSVPFQPIDGLNYTVDPYLEQTFKNLDTVYAKASIRMSYNKFRGKASMGYGRTINGTYQESRYILPNRQGEFSRVRADVDGWVFDTSIGLGYEVLSGKVSLIPYIGYSWHIQSLKTKQSVQDVCVQFIDPECQVGNINESFEYDPRWQGPWIGLDLEAKPSDKIRLYGGIEYHFGEVKGDEYLPTTGEALGWNMVADAQGVVLSGGIAYSIKDAWDLGLETKYTRWESDPGFLYNTTEGTLYLNEINWESYELMFNATYKFYHVNNNKRLSKI